MELFQTVILAIVQGITEFLPISSSAHLEFIPWLFGWPNPSLTFDAALHLGTACAVLLFYAKELLRLVKERSPLLKYVMIGNIPAIIIGLIGERFLDDFFHQSNNGLPFMAVGLIVFGIIIWWIDKTSKATRSLESFTTKDALTLGFAQAIALIPGVSRSGITITTGRFKGFTREHATYVSFLLGIPVTLGAALYKSLDLVTDPASVAESAGVIILGAVISAVVGLISIKWLLQYVKNHSLQVFMWYRIAIGVLILFFWFTR